MARNTSCQSHSVRLVIRETTYQIDRHSTVVGDAGPTFRKIHEVIVLETLRDVLPPKH